MIIFKEIARVLRRYLRKAGYDVVKYEPSSHPLARRATLLSSYEINVVLDVGANTGQYAKQIRDMGYSGKIVSFEPLNSAFIELKENATLDPFWEVYNFALGNMNGKVVINIASNSCSSSILDMLPSHLQAAPGSKYIGKERIEIKSLDSIFEGVCTKKDNIYLKIDTQGFERYVLEGAEKSLSYINTIQLEMSLIALYKDELLFNQIYELLKNKSYYLVSIESGFRNKATAQLLQIDGIFHR
jgi:FkbM family methyltransferase